MTTAIQTNQQAPTGNAVALSVKGLMSSAAFLAKVKAALPRHLSPERYMRIVNNTILRTPALASCDPNSFANGLLLLSQYGLEPDGRRAHLIPFRNNKANRVELQVIIDWKGLAELVLRSGTIAKLHADTICENDDFAFDMGDILHHRINFKEERGAPYAAYALAQAKTGEKFVVVMARGEIEQVRDSSSGWQAFKAGKAKSSPWADWPGEMWKKTAFRRLSKWLPLSPELRDAVELDEDEPPVVTVSSAPVASFELPEPQEEGAAEEQAEEPKAETKEEPAKESKPMPPQAQLADFVKDNGFTFDHFRKFAGEVGAIKDVDSLVGFREVPTAVAEQMLRAKAGMLKGLAMAKGNQ